MKKHHILRLAGLLFVGAFLVPGWNAGQTASGEDAFSSPESLVRGLYAAVSFGPGKPADWGYVRKFFLPETVIVVRKTRTTMEVQNLDMFIRWFEDDAKKFRMDEKGFEETIEKLKLTVFGDTAHCFVVYKARLKTPPDLPGQYGLDSWSLVKKDGRWWVAAITNDIVSPDRPLPEEWR